MPPDGGAEEQTWSVVFLPRTQALSLVTRKHQTQLRVTLQNLGPAGGRTGEAGEEPGTAPDEGFWRQDH